MIRLLLLLAVIVVGCKPSEREILLRKRRDRHLILEGRPTEWYSAYDAQVWSDDNTYEPKEKP